MANLVEASLFDAGVYQIETSDIVQGGPGGIDNRAPQSLTNRTRWLLDNKLALDGSQAMTGSLQVGDGAANRTVSVNGLGAGVGGGSSFISRAAGVLRIAVGNVSSVLGGTYDANGIVLAASDLVLGAGSAPGAVLSAANRHFGVGTVSPQARLHGEQSNPANGVLQVLQNSASSAQTGALVQVGQTGLGSWRYGLVPGIDAWAIYGYAGGAYTEFLKLDSVGRLGLGVSPLNRVHAKFNTATADGLRIENAQNNSYATLTQNGTTGFVASWANATVLEAVCAAGGNFILSAFATPFQIQTGNARTVRFTVNLTGEVGIGKVASGGVQLDVAGQVRSTMTGANFRALNATGNGGGSLGANAGSNGGVTLSGDAGHIDFSADGALRGRWNDTGLRIGAGDASQALDVAGQGRFTLANGIPLAVLSGAIGSYAGIAIGRTAITDFQLSIAAAVNNFVTGSAAGDAVIAVAAANKLLLASGSNFALSIDASQNVVVTKAGVTANLSDFTARSLAASGYQRLPGGLILQWGRTGSLGAGSNTIITLPIAFPAANRIVVVTAETLGGSAQAHDSVSVRTLTNFTLGNASNADSVFSWFALGH